MKGIDISAWQDNIDWQTVVDAGIEFVIVKLGQSGRLDSKFIEHVNNAVAYGLKYGVYLYSRSQTIAEAQAEADWVNQQIREYLNGQTPEMGIWFDMEDQAIADSGADITALCSAFIERLQSCNYDYIGVYSSYNWLTNGCINVDGLPDNTPIWCAQYNYECNFEHPNLKIWQYTDHVSDDLPYDGNEYYE